VHEGSSVAERRTVRRHAGDGEVRWRCCAVARRCATPYNAVERRGVMRSPTSNSRRSLRMGAVMLGNGVRRPGCATVTCEGVEGEVRGRSPTVAGEVGRLHGDRGVSGRASRRHRTATEVEDERARKGGAAKRPTGRGGSEAMSGERASLRAQGRQARDGALASGQLASGAPRKPAACAGRCDSGAIPTASLPR
jgi:hypothetical protein